jgi:hypothetical protein
MTPFGELVDTGRGLVYGNRGCLHDASGEIRRPYQVKRWIACRLDFRGRTRELLQPGRYTELFFLDEATAFAAGHRPCRECRYRDYQDFVTLWHKIHSGEPLRADAIDARLHAERVEPGTRAQRRHAAPFAALPDGSFVVHGDDAFLVLGDRLLRWAPLGYDRSVPRPRSGTAEVLTPPSLVAVLASGWESDLTLLHPSAKGLGEAKASPHD